TPTDSGSPASRRTPGDGSARTRAGASPNASTRTSTAPPSIAGCSPPQPPRTRCTETHPETGKVPPPKREGRDLSCYCSRLPVVVRVTVIVQRNRCAGVLAEAVRRVVLVVVRRDGVRGSARFLGRLN